MKLQRRSLFRAVVGGALGKVVGAPVASFIVDKMTTPAALTSDVIRFAMDTVNQQIVFDFDSLFVRGVELDDMLADPSFRRNR